MSVKTKSLPAPFFDALKCFNEGKTKDAKRLLLTLLEKKKYQKIAQIYFLTAVCFYHEKILDQAVQFGKKALKKGLDAPENVFYIGLMLEENKEFSEAIKCYERVFSKDPTHEQACLRLVAHDFSVAAYDSSEKKLLFSLQKKPSEKLFSKLVEVYRFTSEFDKAEQAAKQALSFGVTPKKQNLLGIVFQDQGKPKAAYEIYENILHEQPDHFDATLNRSISLLEMGKLPECWVAYDAGLVHGQHRGNFEHPAPRWQGESLSGKTILVVPEQGLGEELLFSSCLPDLIEQVGHCVLVCTEKLASLFARSFPEASVYSIPTKEGASLDTAAWPAIDVAISMGSLPRYLRPSLDSFKHQASYLKIDEQRNHFWGAQIDKLGPGLKVGFSWRSAIRKGLRNRNYPNLIEFLSCLERFPEIQFVNLQAEVTEEERKILEAAKINLHFLDCDFWNDLDDMGALMKNLDFLISPATSTALLAGGLGLTTLVPHYRKTWHMLGQNGYPWYSSLNLFFPETPREWGAVLENMSEIISSFEESHEFKK